MVGDYQPVEWTAQFDREPGRGGDFLAAGKAIGILVGQDIAKQPRIERQAGMQVRLPPKDLAWEITLGVW
jgi:hypothetical protein